MTPNELAEVPDNALRANDTRGLIDWLWDHGFHMSLLELDTERRRRGITRSNR